ncbi:uncharacterized protein LOC133915959 isoform X2 [Phragmites australis]|uniref:uncharacterized protein LOC133915959 isoform X2 n=1 Tax=Phragmites australis TaxID=29695 RepID=UPI002D76E95F|nr:uncharacterized protein LOC133915959 isoform X2 [Phragmites australis]
MSKRGRGCCVWGRQLPVGFLVLIYRWSQFLFGLIQISHLFYLLPPWFRRLFVFCSPDSRFPLELGLVGGGAQGTVSSPPRRRAPSRCVLSCRLGARSPAVQLLRCARSRGRLRRVLVCAVGWWLGGLWCVSVCASSCVFLCRWWKASSRSDPSSARCIAALLSRLPRLHAPYCRRGRRGTAVAFACVFWWVCPCGAPAWLGSDRACACVVALCSVTSSIAWSLGFSLLQHLIASRVLADVPHSWHSDLISLKATPSRPRHCSVFWDSTLIMKESQTISRTKMMTSRLVDPWSIVCERWEL